jgi:AF2212-like
MFPHAAMTNAVKAIYENGVFKPKEPVQLQERTEVEVLVPTQAPPDHDDDPTGWAAAEGLIGFIDDAPADMAEHHDHYLYSRPRE